MDTVIGHDPVPCIDDQLLTIEGQLQDLIGKQSREPQPQETAPCNGERPQGQALPPLASPLPPRRRDFKRLIRPAMGIGLLGLALWALLPLLIDVRSTQAVVNAPVVTLRSPIDGTVTFLCQTASGAKVSANTALFRVANSLADDDRLDVLKDEQAHLAARIDGLRRQQASLVALREKLTATVRKYEEARLRTLEVERAEARARVDAAEAVRKQRNSEEDQIDRLQSSHSVSTQDTVAVHFAADAAQHTVVQAQKNMENIDTQIRALRDGVHIGPGDGRNDLPYSAQRLHELSFRIEEVGAALGQDEAKLAQLRRHLLAEEKRTAGRSKFTTTAPADWIVWRRHVTSGAPIKADSPLVDMIDPAEIFIDAVINERNLTRIRPGDKARVRIAGSDKERTAVVRQVIGRTLPWPDRLLAVESTPHDRQEVHVILSFCEPLLNGEKDASAPIGLPADVTFVSARGLF
jgi:multidrug resistance efflux pump